MTARSYSWLTIRLSNDCLFSLQIKLTCWRLAGSLLAAGLWLAGGWLVAGWRLAGWLVVDADFNIKF